MSSDVTERADGLTVTQHGGGQRLRFLQSQNDEFEGLGVLMHASWDLVL